MKIFYTLFFCLFFHITVTPNGLTDNGKEALLITVPALLVLAATKLIMCWNWSAMAQQVTGYSYTYFTEGAKRYYTICKLKGTITKKPKKLLLPNLKEPNTIPLRSLEIVFKHTN